jgi:hypothetical protein
MAAHCIFTKDTSVRDSGFSAGESVAKGAGSSTVTEAVNAGQQTGGRQKIVSVTEDGLVLMDDKAALIMHGTQKELLKACAISDGDPDTIATGAASDKKTLSVYFARPPSMILTPDYMVVVAGPDYWDSKNPPLRTSGKKSGFEQYAYADNEVRLGGTDDPRNQNAEYLALMVAELDIYEYEDE